MRCFAVTILLMQHACSNPSISCIDEFIVDAFFITFSALLFFCPQTCINTYLASCTNTKVFTIIDSYMDSLQSGMFTFFWKHLHSRSSFRWVQLGINMPARAESTVRKSCDTPQLVGEPTGELYEIIIFFGIIDILQDYDISKKLEHAYKSFQYDPTSISAVDPRLYSKRFRDFIFRVFVED